MMSESQEHNHLRTQRRDICCASVIAKDYFEDIVGVSKVNCGNIY